MADRFAWFGTVHLWQYFQHWDPQPSRGGSMEHDGATRTNVYLSPGSPNFRRRVTVECVVGPTAAQGSLSGAEVAEIQIRTTELALLALGKTKQDLKWTANYSGGAGSLVATLSECVFVEMKAEPPDVQTPQFRRVTYTFESSGTYTLAGIAGFGASPLS